MALRWLKVYTTGDDKVNLPMRILRDESLSAAGLVETDSTATAVQHVLHELMDPAVDKTGAAAPANLAVGPWLGPKLKEIRSCKQKLLNLSKICLSCFAFASPGVCIAPSERGTACHL